MDHPKVIADGKEVTCIWFEIESGPDIWESTEGSFGSVRRDVKPFPMARLVQGKYDQASIRFIAKEPPQTIKAEFQGKTYDRVLSKSAEQRWAGQWECEAVLSVSA